MVHSQTYILFSIWKMHQICDGYNPKVRMGNWFEESYAVSQPYRNHPEKQSRQPEIDIGYLDSHLKLRPLNRVARMPHWNTTGLVEAPQFHNQVNKTTVKQNYDVGVVGHFFREWKPRVYDKNGGVNSANEASIKIDKCKRDFKMFDQHNVNELLQERPSDTASFKSSLVPAKHIEPATLLKTIYQRDISETSAARTLYQINSSVSQLQKPAFRKIRSEITLKNMPTITTYK